MASLDVREANIHVYPPGTNGPEVIRESGNIPKSKWKLYLLLATSSLIAGSIGYWIGNQGRNEIGAAGAISISSTGTIHNYDCRFYKPGSLRNCNYCGGLNR